MKRGGKWGKRESRCDAVTWVRWCRRGGCVEVVDDEGRELQWATIEEDERKLCADGESGLG